MSGCPCGADPDGRGLLCKRCFPTLMPGLDDDQFWALVAANGGTTAAPPGPGDPCVSCGMPEPHAVIAGVDGVIHPLTRTGLCCNCEQLRHLKPRPAPELAGSGPFDWQDRMFLAGLVIIAVATTLGVADTAGLGSSPVLAGIAAAGVALAVAARVSLRGRT